MNKTFLRANSSRSRISRLNLKILLMVLIGTLLTIATTGSSSFIFMKSVLEKSIMDRQLESSRAIMRRIDYLLYDRFIDIQSVAGEKAFEEFLLNESQGKASPADSKKSLLKRLRSLSMTMGSWDVLFVVDIKGNIVLSVADTVLGPNVNAYPYKAIAFDESIRGKNYYSDRVISKDTGEPTIIYSAPIRDNQAPDKPIIGVVVGNFSWPAVTELLGEAPIPAVLINKNKMIIADNFEYLNIPLTMDTKAPVPIGSLGKKPVQVLSKEESLLREQAITSMVSQPGYLSYAGNGWNLILSNPAETAFAPANAAAIKLMLILIPLIVLQSLLIVIFVARVVVKPIIQLTDASRQIAEGNLSKQVNVRSRDEIGELSASFNHMTSKLRLSHEELERKVKTRTQELSEEKERLSVTLKSLGEAVVTTDEKGQITLLNKAAEELSGWTQQEALNLQLHEVVRVVDEKSGDRPINLVDSLFEASGVATTNHECALISKNGAKRIVAETGSSIRDAQNRIIGAVFVLRDITGQRKLEAQLIQSQKMETIGTLAGGIAHDLNNQLTPVVGYLDLIITDVDPKSPVHQLLTEAKDSAIRCVDIVSRLKNFSRPSDLKKSVFSMDKILEEMNKFLRKIFPSNIEIKINYEKNLWLVEGNETEIQTVLLNLATNAKDAMAQQGGKLVITARNIDFDSNNSKLGQAAKRCVVIDVQDTGAGISTDGLSHVFEPFFTTKRKQGGTGLGLSMVFNIIKSYGGWVDVSSQSGLGTTFHIYLPATNKEKSVNVEDEQLIESAPPNTTILFADDEETVRQLGKLFLERLGYNVLLAQNGPDALEIYQAEKNHIDLVIMDMTMPKLTGVQVLGMLLEINPNCKIIISSGHTQEASTQELIRKGAKDFLAKPYTISPLSLMVKKILNMDKP